MCRILAVGDHGQLPPVGSAFNLMASPQVRLDHIFRQAENSPIIEVATLARMNGNIPVGEYGPGVVKLDRRDPETGQKVQELLENYRSELMILCGYNKTRINLNRTVRGYMGYETFEPASGDRVVCLRNNRRTKLYNGMTGNIGYLSNAEDDKDSLWYFASIDLDNEDYRYEGYIARQQFDQPETIKQLPKSPDPVSGDLFDFGYALTVHKAQGSQSRKVLLFEERFPRMTDDDWRRWLYTAVTRASEELIIIGS